MNQWEFAAVSERGRSDRSDKTRFAQRLVLSAMFGLTMGLFEVVLVVGGYWFEFSSQLDIRRFALLALTIDVAAASAIFLVLVRLVGARWGLPATAFGLGWIVGWFQVTHNHPVLQEFLGGRLGTAVGLTSITLLLTIIFMRIPALLPEVGRVRRRYVALLGVAAIAAILPSSDERVAAGEGSNVLLVVVDTLRADSTGFNGADQVKTPFLDRLSR